MFLILKNLKKKKQKTVSENRAAKLKPRFSYTLKKKRSQTNIVKIKHKRSRIVNCLPELPKVVFFFSSPFFPLAFGEAFLNYYCFRKMEKRKKWEMVGDDEESKVANFEERP